jgi:hypothetical protein
MTSIDMTIPLKEQLANSEMVQQTFAYWFSDHEHVRSPFPFYVQQEVKDKSVLTFAAWIGKLNPKANEEINDEIAHEKFEEVLFEQATALVKTDDEVLTLRFPFLPRVGDKIAGEGIEGRSGENIIQKRYLTKEGKDEFMEVKAQNVATGGIWETRFALP